MNSVLLLRLLGQIQAAPSSQPIELSSTVAPEKPTNPIPLNLLLSQEGMILLVCAAGLGLLNWKSGDVKAGTTRKNAKAKAKWADRKAIRHARKVALTQLRERKRNSAAVWIVKPKQVQYPASMLQHQIVKQPNGKVIPSRWVVAPEMGPVPQDDKLIVKGEKHHWYDRRDQKWKAAETIWVPDTQRGTLVVGAPGSGKTFSAIDPMVRSIVEQGHSLLLYDFKYPGQTQAIAWYAEKLGYRVHVFAPGFPESDVLNLLDFLTGDPQEDAALARQLANVMNANFKLGQGQSSDPFFDQAGDQLVQAVMMLAKQMPHADLMTAQVILSAPQLVDRLFPEDSNLDPWIRKAFDQLFSVKDSDKTVSSIVGTATLNFTRLMMAKILACCVGESTLPLDIDGKTLIIFGLDRELRDVVSPIVATALHMIVNRNLFRKGGRKNPLYVVLDEFPTLLLRQVKNWLNESRSDGFNGILGIQNLTQLKKTYGDEDAKAIIGGCATKFIFNTGEPESAEYFSKLFGEEEVARRNISRSRSGGKGGNSTSRAIDVYTRKLVAPEEFTSLSPGEAVFTNPQYISNGVSYQPRRIQFHLPPWELELAGLIEQNWEPLRQRLIARTAQYQQIPTQEAVWQRMQEFDEQFPIPAAETPEEETTPSLMDMLANLLP